MQSCRQVRAFLTTAVDDSAFAEVVRGQFNGDGVTRENSDVVFPHLAGDMRSHDMTVLQLDPKGRVRQRLGHDAFHLQRFFFSQFP